MMCERFAWRGEPIPDIRAWARERGEQMISYRQWRRVPTLVYDEEGNNTVVDVLEERFGSMPESFWNTLAIMHGWTYTELARETA